MGTRAHAHRMCSCVYLRASYTDKPPFIGRITDLWEDHVANEKRMMVQWFYRSSEMRRKGKNGSEKKVSSPDVKELYLSTAEDWNPLDSIIGLCIVIHYNLVQDWKALRSTEDTFFYQKLFDPAARSVSKAPLYAKPEFESECESEIERDITSDLDT